jgi:hypothetical protein
MSKGEAAHADAQATGRARLNYFNYFTEIEDAFVRRRGKHLLVSPLDWSLMESWKAAGVPLHVVLRGIERAFDSYEARPRNRSVKSLFYCQEEVEAQFAEWLESRRGAATEEGDAAREAGATGEAGAVGEGGAGGDDGSGAAEESRGLPFPRAVIAAHLSESREALARSLDARRRSEGFDALCEALARAAARLEELASDFGRAARPDAEMLEASLSDLEALLDRALRASLPAEVLAEKRAEAEEQLRKYRGRMEHATYEQTRDNLLAKALREEAGVPRLSLFYL